MRNIHYYIVGWCVVGGAWDFRSGERTPAQITGVNGNILYLGHLAMDTTCKSLKKNHPVDVNFIKITKAYNSSKIIEKKTAVYSQKDEIFNKCTKKLLCRA